MTSGYRIDRLFRVPDVHQRASFNAFQLATGFEPSFNSNTLFFADRATLLQANQTVVIAAHVAKAIGLHRFFQECVEESVDSLVVQTFVEIQVQLEAQLLKFINAQFLRRRWERLVAMEQSS